MTIVEAVRWSADGDAVDISDQRRLPAELIRRNLRSEGDVCDAIATLAVRGAPAIGMRRAATRSVWRPGIMAFPSM
jgi:methylthioribose-1-phosphate isomerase